MTSSAPDRALALVYAPAACRPALAALFALDDRLAETMRSTREPLIGQMRMTWWHDALTALDSGEAPAEPLLGALKDEVISRGVSGAVLAGIVTGWEELLAPDPLSDAALEAFAMARGGGLFAAAATVLGAAASDPAAAAGAGWALVDLAHHAREPRLAVRARALAAAHLEPACRARWSRAGRPLGALAHLARLDEASPARRTMRALVHRLTGL